MYLRWFLYIAVVDVVHETGSKVSGEIWSHLLNNVTTYRVLYSNKLLITGVE